MISDIARTGNGLFDMRYDVLIGPDYKRWYLPFADNDLALALQLD